MGEKRTAFDLMDEHDAMKFYGLYEDREASKRDEQRRAAIQAQLRAIPADAPEIIAELVGALEPFLDRDGRSMVPPTASHFAAARKALKRAKEAKP